MENADSVKSEGVEYGRGENSFAANPLAAITVFATKQETSGEYSRRSSERVKVAPAPYHVDKTMRSDEEHRSLDDEMLDDNYAAASVLEPAVVDELEKQQKIDFTTSAKIESPPNYRQHLLQTQKSTNEIFQPITVS